MRSKADETFVIVRILLVRTAQGIIVLDHLVALSLFF